MRDERFTIILDEARHAVARQESAVDELRARAGAVLTAASISAAFLGGLVFADGRHVGAWGQASVILFGMSGCAVAIVLWPRAWRFVSNPSKMLDTYIVGDDPMTLEQMQWHLAERMQERYVANERKRGWMLVAVEASVCLVSAQTLTSLVELAGW